MSFGLTPTFRQNLSQHEGRKKVDGAHLGNTRPIAKFNLSLSKALKKKPCHRVSTRSTIKNHEDDIMIELSNDLTNLKRNVQHFI